jgi:hypothetical protein
MMIKFVELRARLLFGKLGELYTASMVQCDFSQGLRVARNSPTFTTAVFNLISSKPLSPGCPTANSGHLIVQIGAD